MDIAKNLIVTGGEGGGGGGECGGGRGQAHGDKRTDAG